MSEWRVEQVTSGGADGRFHSHSYYDLPAIDAAGGRVAVHRMGFEGRPPTPEDAIEIGLVDADRPGSWAPVGESRAWSWQQGPMAQFVAGGPRLVWNDREGGRFVARLVDPESGARDTLPRPVYAVDPAGRFALSLNMARLDGLRPGYGYPGGAQARLDEPRPAADGVRRLDLETGADELILPLAEAVAFLRRMSPLGARLRHGIGRFTYWFNHAKIAPDGRRFTVKLRWRRPGGHWDDRMGVSLTCGMDGRDLRLLADATSHVIWLDPRRLYFWRRDRVALYEDASPRGRPLDVIAPEIATSNVHIRHLPPGAESPDRFVLDTPYRETVDLMIYDARRGAAARIARFTGHRPARGQFRCDLHPCPSADGRRIVVTSVQDGGRQVYVLTRI